MRSAGVPLIRNNQLATSAEAAFDAFSSESTAASGNGIMKARKKIGNMAECAHLVPRNKNAPAMTNQTNESAINVMWSFWPSSVKYRLADSAPVPANANSKAYPQAVLSSRERCLHRI